MKKDKSTSALSSLMAIPKNKPRHKKKAKPETIPLTNEEIGPIDPETPFETPTVPGPLVKVPGRPIATKKPTKEPKPEPFFLDVPAGQKKPTKQEREIAKAMIMSGKPTVLSKAEQLTPEEEDARDKAAKKPAEKKVPAKVSTAPSSTWARAPIGIIATITTRLLMASEKKPVTKREIFDLLVMSFPDRAPTSMMNTIDHNVVPGIMDVTGHNIVKTGKGTYYATAKPKTETPK